MAVAEVDDAVRVGGGGAEHVEVVQAAAAHLGAGRGDRGGSDVRASQTDHLVTGLEQLGDGGGADPATGAGDEDAHEGSPRPKRADA